MSPNESHGFHLTVLNPGGMTANNLSSTALANLAVSTRP